MPADRLLHPRLGHSERVNLLTDLEFRVWVQYLLTADDFGVMRADAVTLQAANDHLAHRPRKMVQRCLDRLVSVGLLRAFDHQGRRYVYQADWQDWQHVGYPRQTINPPPPAGDCSAKTRKHLERHSTNATEEPDDDLPKVPQILSEDLPPSRARETANGLRLTANGSEGERERKPAAPAMRPGAGSKRPVFVGNRLTVFEWQLDALVQILGPHVEAFRIDAWLDQLDRETAVVLPAVREQRWTWLQQQLVLEASRRGLPVATDGSGAQLRRPPSAADTLAQLDAEAAEFAR